MEDLALKIRLSVLWLFGELAWLVYMILAIMEPGKIEQLLLGEIEGMEVTPELLLMFAVIFLIPLVMAFLSLTLKGTVNRWPNIILGIVYTILGLLDLIEALAKPSPYAILMMLAAVMASALIVWYAWKWPEEKG